MLFRKQWDGQYTAVEGKACSVINVATFIGDLLAFICSGPIIGLFGSSNAIMMIACLSGAIALLCSSFIKVPEKN